MEQAELAAPTILIVEDEVLFRLELADLFEASGYRVVEAGDADEATAILHQDPSIRIVLTDIEMPGSMDGLRLGHYVRECFPPVTLVIASGALRPSPADLPERSLYLSKPFNPFKLLRRLNEVV
jgi:CheY-like chemotaxis protein